MGGKMIERYSYPKVRRLWTDEHKFKKWLEVESAVMEAEEEIGIIPRGISKKFKKNARFDVKRIKELEKIVNHDVIAFITNVEETVGKEGKYVHYGLTSSDVIDTANALIIKEVSNIIIKEIERLRGALKNKADEFKFTPIMGRTHGIHAEVTTLGLKFLSFFAELSRAREDFLSGMSNMMFGKISGAVGNYSNVPPDVEKIALKRLGLSLEPVSSQIVPRDRYIRFLSGIVMIGEAIERIAMEIRHLQRTEIREVEEPFGKGQKGSSAMPHKRNPILCERMCGMARILRGYLVSFLENNALWDERDISHSSVERIVLPNATELICYMLNKTTYIISNLKVYGENLSKNIELLKGLPFSGKVLLFLVKKGFSREKAYKIVQRNSMNVWKGRGSLKELLLVDKDLKDRIDKSEMDTIFKTVPNRNTINSIFKRVYKKYRLE